MVTQDMIPSLDITVILSVYNYEQYLPKALDSILAQAQLPRCVILVDDASTDNSFAILERYAEVSPIFEVRRLPTNQGVNAVFSCCLKEVTTEYVFFMAADDIILPELFIEAVALLDAYPEAAFYSALSYVIDAKGKYVKPYYTPYLQNRVNYLTGEDCHKIFSRYGSWIHGGTRVLRVAMLRQCDCLFDDALLSYADLFLAIDLALKHGACYSPRFRSLVRIHSNNYSSQTMFNLIALNTIKNKVFDALRIGGILSEKELTAWQRRFIITSLVHLFSSKSRHVREELINFIPRDYMLSRVLIKSFYPVLLCRIKWLNAAILYLSIKPFDFFQRIKGALKLRIHGFWAKWQL